MTWCEECGTKGATHYQLGDRHIRDAWLCKRCWNRHIKRARNDEYYD